MVVLRVANYERVSTDEQALRGFSVEAQIDALNEYCEKNKMKVVDHYIDAGVSGGKPAFKRPQMSRLLEDVKEGKIDMVLFTRLDRWFRNVQEYFKVQEILDAHGVAWKAIQEDYDTTTANGRMAITIFLAIAQNEREKTADRVKAVLAHKRSKREACFGGMAIPIGYMKQKDENGVMRLVKDPETEPIVQEFWDILIKYDNANLAARTINQKYGIARTQKTWFDMIRSDFYCGIHRGVEDYCEPYVSVEDWLRFQQSRSKVPSTKKNRTYLFSGLIRCPVCGRLLCGSSTVKDQQSKKEYYSYRCRNRYTATCDFRKTIAEKKTERHLLKYLDKYLEKEIANVELKATQPKPKPKVNINALREKLRRLDIAYMAGNRTDEEYLTEQAEIKKAIAQAEKECPPEKPRDLTILKETLESDFRTIYKGMDKLHQQRFWRGLLKEIYVEGNDVKGVKFIDSDDIIFF